MLHHFKCSFVSLRHVCAALFVLCLSPHVGALTVSPSPSYTGSYTVSWPSWGATGCTYDYYDYYPFVHYSCYWLEELAPGGNWTTVSMPNYSTSWTASGKPVGTYQYRLQYAYGDIDYGNQYVIDGPVSVQVWDVQPPLPPEQVPPDLANPPFRCNVVTKEHLSNQPADLAISSWYYDTYWGFLYPIVYPPEMRHESDDPSCLLVGPAPDTLIPRPMALLFARGPSIPIPNTPYYAFQWYKSLHQIVPYQVPISYCDFFFPFPCEVAGAELALGIDPINWKWIGRWTGHSALVIPY